MNKYILKVAAFILNTDKSLPYRPRVEVAIFRDGQVLLTKNKDQETGKVWYGFPGGGVEKGQSEAQAARLECLEEVGVAVKNLRRTDIEHKEEGMSDKDGRHKQFRGSITHVFTADYDGIDRSKLGDDNDSRQYVWKGPKEAREALRGNRLDSRYRVEAITALKA